MAQPRLVAVGRISRAHGLAGRVLVVPYNDDSKTLARAKTLWLRRTLATETLPATEERRVEVVEVRSVDLGFLIGIKGCDDRDAAHALRGTEVLVPRESLAKLETDEFYTHDLVGLHVFDGAGKDHGAVDAVEAMGLNTLLRIGSGASEVLIPLGLVRSVDVAARRVVVEAPEGLFELDALPDPEGYPDRTPDADPEAEEERKN